MEAKKYCMHHMGRQTNLDSRLRTYLSREHVGIFFMVFALPLAMVASFSFSTPAWREQSILTDCGISSLAAISPLAGSKDSLFFAGTKRGKVHCIQWSGRAPIAIEALDEIKNDHPDAKPFPIYSMAGVRRDGHEDDSLELFCGGGDRYISVWQRRGSGELKRTQRLGPHTGWAKDLLYDHQRDMLHSIGCNCIESWKGDTDGVFSHVAKRSIESSRDQGATLSSDMLCLCATNEVLDSFTGGGVDGRIHCWALDPMMQDPLCSISAHKGRINVMAYAPIAQLLFSAGHDGTVQCRFLSDKVPLQDAPDALLDILGANGKSTRITTMSFVEDSANAVQLVIGTATGELAMLRASIYADAVHFTELPNSRVQLTDEPMINAICTLERESSSDPERHTQPLLVVGHSRGLSLIVVKGS